MPFITDCSCEEEYDYKCQQEYDEEDIKIAMEYELDKDKSLDSLNNI